MQGRRGPRCDAASRYGGREAGGRGREGGAATGPERDRGLGQQERWKTGGRVEDSGEQRSLEVEGGGGVDPAATAASVAGGRRVAEIRRRHRGENSPALSQMLAPYQERPTDWGWLRPFDKVDSSPKLPAAPEKEGGVRRWLPPRRV